MEDIIINSVKLNVVLPAQKMERSKPVRSSAETNKSTESTNKNSGKYNNMNIDLEKSVQKIKEFSKTYTTKLAFSVDPESKEAIIYVTNRDTGKIIRQIPPEEIQKINERMDEIVGILFSGRA